MIAVGLFVVRYSGVDIVSRQYSLDRTASSVERTPDQRDALRENGVSTRILEVRGHLFFGTATAVFDEKRLVEDSGAPLRRIVFDLTGVTGMDSSLGMAIPRLDRAAVRQGTTLVFSGVTARLRGCFDPAIAGMLAPVEVFADLDTALRWCEDRVLDEAIGTHAIPERVDLADSLGRRLGDEESSAVLRHARRLELTEGDRVTTVGQPSPGLIFVESGALRVVIEGADGEQLVLRRLAPGSLVGEVGHYRRQPASATVIADSAGVVWLLPADEIDRLHHSDPAIAAAIHRFSASVLADRVIHAERGLRSDS
jgi:SulP family sulfate permease